LWRKAHLYLPEKGALLSWLYRVCRNLCLDRLKHAQNKWELKMPRDSIFHELMNSPSAVAVGTDAAMVEQMVAVALQNLAEAERELIELSFFRGLSHAEIARTLHLPLGTVKTRIASALRKLRHSLGSIWLAGEDF
jgi:RNA polymerase sigma-70 factor (ECF subfamily)